LEWLLQQVSSAIIGRSGLVMSMIWLQISSDIRKSSFSTLTVPFAEPCSFVLRFKLRMWLPVLGVVQAWPNHQMLLSGPEATAAAACGLPSISSFHAGSHPTHAAVGYETQSSPVPPVTGSADVHSSAQTGAALGRALASVCVGFCLRLALVMLILVLVLKDSLRTKFKSLSLSWSLCVKSLSLSLQV